MAIPDLNPRDVMCDQCLGTIEISFQQQSSISIDPGNVKDLKHSQYKNDDIQLKNFLGLKLPPFFLHRVGDGKRLQFQNQEGFQLYCAVLILTAL